jgi:hypothetical protein
MFAFVSEFGVGVWQKHSLVELHSTKSASISLSPSNRLLDFAVCIRLVKLHFSPQQRNSAIPNVQWIYEWSCSAVPRSFGVYVCIPEEIIKNRTFTDTVWHLERLKARGSWICRSPKQSTIFGIVHTYIHRYVWRYTKSSLIFRSSRKCTYLHMYPVCTLKVPLFSELYIPM